MGWTQWVANGSPQWVAYRALMARILVALDKCLGVRPMDIIEAIHGLMEKLV